MVVNLSNRLLKVTEANHSIIVNSLYPQVFARNTGEKLRLDEVECILGYHVPNKHKNPKAYHLLFMLYPFRNTCELKTRQAPSYCTKTQEARLLGIINENKNLLEPLVDEVNNMLFGMQYESGQDEENKNCALRRDLGNILEANVILSDSNIVKIVNTDNTLILWTTGHSHI